MKTHPPKTKQEVFLGNTRQGIHPDFAHYKTLRLAKPAYTIDGEELPNYEAMFLNESEIGTYNSAREKELTAIRMNRNKTL